MKKLLSILAAVAFTASVSSTVVACGTTSSDNTKRYSKIDSSYDDEKIISLADGRTISVGDIKDTSNMDSYIQNKLDEMVSKKYADDYNSNNIANNKLSLINKNRSYRLQGSNVNAYATDIDGLNIAGLSTNLFSQYTSSITGNNIPLDEDAYFDGLNPNAYGSTAYSIWMNDGTTLKRWTTNSEIGQYIGKQYLPTANDLENNTFVLLKSNKDLSTTNSLSINDLTMKESEVKSNGYEIIESNLTGHEALLYRFQNYIQKNNSTSMSDAFNMEYAKNNMYRISERPNDSTGLASDLEKQTNNSLYLDTTSKFASGVQSWSTSANNAITSNYKMVWSLSMSKSDAAKMNTTLQNLVNITSDSTYSRINSKSIKTFVDEFKKDGKNVVSDNIGSDPYFGVDGYQGIVGSDGKRVDGGSMNIDSNASSNIKNVEGFGILRKGFDITGTPTYDFEDQNDKNDKKSFIIVMPIYLLDLLRTIPQSSDITSTSTNTLNNVARGEWIELNPQNSNDSWKSTDKFSSSDFTNFSLGTDKDVLPTSLSMNVFDGKTYIFIPKDNTKESGNIAVNGQTITVNLKDTSTDDKSYGISGTFSSNDGKASDLNGQNVKYKIHLGIDGNTPDLYERIWTTRKTSQNVNDIATLSSANKESLMNTLLYLVTKADSSIGTAARTEIYHLYFSLDDVLYQGLYDKIKDYMKEDDSTDESN